MGKLRNTRFPKPRTGPMPLSYHGRSAPILHGGIHSQRPTWLVRPNRWRGQSAGCPCSAMVAGRSNLGRPGFEDLIRLAKRWSELKMRAESSAPSQAQWAQALG